MLNYVPGGALAAPSLMARAAQRKLPRQPKKARNVSAAAAC